MSESKRRYHHRHRSVQRNDDRGGHRTTSQERPRCNAYRPTTERHVVVDRHAIPHSNNWHRSGRSEHRSSLQSDRQSSYRSTESKHCDAERRNDDRNRDIGNQIDPRRSSSCSGSLKRPHSQEGNNLKEGQPPKKRGHWPKKELRPTGYKRLQELLSKEKEEILIQLSSTNFGFQELLNQKEEIRRDLRALILRAIVCACECTTAQASLNSFLGKLQNSEFFYHVQHHIMSLKDDGNDKIQYEVEIQDIITVIRTMIHRLPDTIDDVKPSILLLTATTDDLLAEGLINEYVMESFKELKKLSKNTQGAVRKKKFNVDGETPPPDNFREISIFPTINDLTADYKPYLRKNRLGGSYDDVDHYLDVHFRLIREDLVRPLREGIKEYLHTKDDSNKRITSIRIYYDVTIEYPVCSHDCVLYRVHFDVSRLKGVRWQSTKRLIYGSLVCLSPDDFKSVYFATVANRDVKDLENGFVDLKLENEEEFEKLNECRYTMVETSSFFEAYRHVLKSLQEITETSMPMKSYIIKGHHKVEAPSYLRHNMTMTYDLTPLVNDTTKCLVRLAGNSWPTAKSLQLDESQFTAFRNALTKEFVVIQGPPGTGKTYIGLKIVQALLYNSECWTIDAVHHRVKHSPIFVVCFTNHALDQFLEGIHSFVQTGIVRVGGRSKSEILNSYNLSQLRKKLREVKEVPRYIFDRKRDIEYEMRELRGVMDLAEERIKLTTRGVLCEMYIETWMSCDHYKSLTQNRINNENIVVTWLGLGETIVTDTVVDSCQNIANKLNEEPVKEEDDDDDDREMDFAEEEDLLIEQRLIDTDVANDETLNLKEIDTLRQTFVYGFQLTENKKEARYLKRQLQSYDKMTDIEAAKVDNIWNLGLDDRWRLYRLWISKYCNQERQTLFANNYKYNELGKQLQEITLEENLFLMKDAKVIGMTTTGAAKCRNMIQRIQPKIVIVEEAAEVLEAHIVSSVTQGCEHLILIGDHQQLRPNPTVYDLAKKFNLEISLFERMVKNGMSCHRLDIQHRMRPEISSLMKNYFYNGLQDAKNVKLYENVKGISNNMFFIEHNHQETALSDTFSQSNIYEAEFLVNLSKYLIQQGYKPTEITILTTYTGQLFQFKKLMTSKLFNGIHVCTVDNYQGEENEIVLLSLVRSNEEGKIGFLKEKNRMCVALSRAKKGFFCIGNMKLLAAKDKNWGKIVKGLKQKKLIGDTIRLCCQNHPEASLDICEPKDFDNCPEGGCKKPCSYKMQCGHVCKKLCHSYDPEHKNIKCLEPCSRMTCTFGHPCTLYCYQKCKDNCDVQIERHLPCEHKLTLPCFKNKGTVVCVSDCQKILRCHHACKEKCSQPCTAVCCKVVNKSLPCGHNGEYKCYVTDPLDCSSRCAFSLKCGHLCEGTCGGCKNGRLHKLCGSKCGRKLVCGHECIEPCTRNCPPCRKPCQNRCVHSKCPKKCGEKCTPCRMRCEWQCKHHECTKQCGELCNRKRCNKPCKKSLKRCGHVCAGLCGEPCPNKCLICDKEELTTILFGNEDEPDARFIELEDCGHVIESKGLDRWIDLEDKSVQSKACPVCKTPIRRNLRYGNIIKQIQIDIERVKDKVNGQISFDDKKKLRSEIEDLSDREIRKSLRHEHKLIKTPKHVADMHNKIQFLEKLEKIRGACSDIDNIQYKTIERKIKTDIETLKNYILKPRSRFSEQLLEDILSELQRISFLVELHVHKSKLQASQISKNNLTDSFTTVEKCFTDVGPLKEDDINKIQACLKNIRDNCGRVPGISEEERLQIVKAIGLSKGHWFKCPKGHIYAIGECGGATVESVCPECKSKIGGKKHHLRDDNKLASEMDDAQYASWSEQANMENYILDNIV
ncbi:NFX1-type zinc finger-containing protein 1-like [Antedon mediterranea]|uniref:NFX1-type zinc finger-containing protein 1-like n=1 Tax=Antedon mediterranea TaxID=105859 RepID=UPI003AF4F946